MEGPCKRRSEGESSDVVMIVESMKMEISITASSSGTISRILKKEGSTVTAGQALFVIKEENS